MILTGFSFSVLDFLDRITSKPLPPPPPSRSSRSIDETRKSLSLKLTDESTYLNKQIRIRRLTHPTRSLPNRQQLQAHHRPIPPTHLHVSQRHHRSQFPDSFPLATLRRSSFQQSIFLQRPFYRCPRATCRVHFYLSIHGES